MEYNVTMPILSDTMDSGKIVKWYVKEGDIVKKGDKLCEVESDKAIMDIESFVDGVVKKILVKENESVKVKTPIAIIEKSESKEIKKEKKEETYKISSGVASPAAKYLANKLNLDITKLQNENKLPTPAHIKDVNKIAFKRYFTKKALKIYNQYKLNYEFNLNHKITSKEVLNYIKKENIPKIEKLSPNQLAVIKNLTTSITKPTFFIFEEVKIKKREHKLTSIFLKAIALAMQKNPLTRSILKGDTLYTYPTSNISVAVNREDGLFMCVIKEVENKSLKEIDRWLKEIKTKRLTLNDLKGSTFGISNLGMFDISSFTALINESDCAIAAIGKMENEKVKINFTFDHRILNGVEAAKFIKNFKEELACMM